MEKHQNAKDKSKKKTRANKKNINNITNSGSKNKKNKGSKKIGKKILLTFLLIIVILLAYFGIQIVRNGGGMTGIVTTVVGSNSEKVKNLEDLYALCMGKSQNMTDTIMIVKYSPKTQSAAMLSVPRDSFVGTNKDKATAFDKINAKYQLNPQNTIDAVNKLTGLNLKYYVTIDTKALRDLVDAIGGVYFDVPIDMDYDDSSQDLEIHLEKGYQLLNGTQAEGVVRFRHNNNGTSYSYEYGDNDLGRMKTQRAFIQAVISQTMKASNITKINEILKIANEEVETNMSWNDIKDYIAALMKFDTSNLKTDALPGTAQYCNNLSFFIVNEAQSKEKVQELFFEEQNTAESNETQNEINNDVAIEEKKAPKNSEVELQVINGTGNASKFNNAITQLKNQGYKITKKGTTNLTPKTLIINRKNVSSSITSAIKALLCTGVEKMGEDNASVDYTIIIGCDY